MLQPQRPKLLKTIALELMPFSCSNSEDLQNESIFIGIPSQKKDIKVLEFNNLESTKSFLNSLNLDNTEISSDDVNFIKLKTENFDELDENDLKKLGEKCSNKSVVIFFESQINRKLSIHWKSKDLNNFFALRPHSGKYSNDVEIYEFVADFFAESLRVGHLGYQTSLLNDETITNISIFELVDSRGYNLLLLASEAGKISLTKNLLRLGLDTKSHVSNVSAQDLALNNGHYELIMELYAENLPLPASVHDNHGPNNFRNFIKLLNNFHKMIEADNLEKVKQIIEKLPKTNQCYVPTNESALKVAVEKKSFKSYEFFVSIKLRFAPHESPEKYFEKLYLHEQRELREIHSKYIQELPEKHINVLIDKSFLSHDVPDADEKRMFIHRAYESLNKDEMIKITLKIVAASKNFRIIYDFNRDAINIANPTEDDTTEGKLYPDGRIYVGAKNLLSDDTAHKTLAVIAHELCHFTVNLVYDNNAKPYKSDDKTAMDDFQKISQFCKENKEQESIINNVYESYPEGMHHAELIVRVPHLIVKYRSETEKFDQVRENFEQLFEFYKNKTMPDMEETLKKIDIEPENIIKKQHKKISKLKKVSKFLTVLSILGIMAAILVGFIFYNPELRNFDELSSQEQDQVRNGAVKYKKVEVKFHELFPENSTAYGKLSSNHIAMLLNGKILSLCDSHFHYLEELVKHDWRNLTQKLKDKFLSSNFTFQDENLKLSELHDLHPDVFNSLSSEQIANVLDSKELKVGSMIKNETQFYVERKLWDENINEIYYAYMQSTHGGDTPCQCSCFNLTGSNKTFEMFYKEFRNESFQAQARKINAIMKSEGYKVCSLYEYKIRESDYPFESSETILSHKSLQLDFNEVLKKVNETKIFILSAEPSSGKTITYEQLTIRIKRKFPTRWVSYINFKDHKDLYRNVETLDDVSKMLEKILDLSSKNSFEKSIFDELFKSGRVVLLWRDLDELCADYIKFVLNILNIIKENTGNIQFISTRPLHAEKLHNKFEIETYTLIPFTREEQENYVRQFLMSKEISEEKISEFVKKVQRIDRLTKLKEGFDTPLLLQMIAELFTKDTQIYETENLYEIYEKFVNERIRTWMNSENAKNLSMIFITSDFNVNILYQQYAMRSEFQSEDHAHKFAYFNSLKLNLMRKKVPKELTNDEISRMGILYITCPKSFKFIQRTFAEFFIAQYFVERIYIAADDPSDEEAEQRIRAFYHIFSYPFHRVRSFIKSFLQTERGQKSKFFPQTISRVLRTKFQRLYFNSLQEFNEVPLLEFFAKDHNVLTDLLQIGESETLYTATFDYVYSSGVKHGFLQHSGIKDFGKKYLNDDEYLQLIDHKDQKGVILFSIYCLKSKMLDAQINGTQIYHDKYIFDLVTLENDNPFYAFQMIARNLTKIELKELLTSEIILSSFSMQNDTGTSNFIDKVWNLIEDNLSIDEQKKLLSKFVGSSSILEDTSNLNFILNKMEFFFSNEEIYEMLSNTSILHSGINFQPLWDFVVSHMNRKQQELILRKTLQHDCLTILDNSKHCYVFPPLNILQSSLFSVDGLSSFSKVAKIYEIYFNKTEVQEIIFSSSTQFLAFVITQGDNNLCDGFVEYLKRLFDGNEELLKEYLLQKIELANLNVFQFLINFSDPKNCLELFSNLSNGLQNV